MKKLILKWLGISAIEEKINDLTQCIDKEAQQRMVGEAFYDVLKGTPDIEYFISWNAEKGKNLFLRVLDEAAKKQAGLILPDMIDKHIAAEEFIDKIIERIKRKQLNS